MSKLFLLAGALFGGMAVALGAFGAHALKTRLSPDMLAAWHTAVNYQFFHALALLAVGILLQRQAGATLLVVTGALFILGILLFSGSLYGLALAGWKWLGPVTPLGGLCLIAGWICLVTAIAKT